MAPPPPLYKGGMEVNHDRLYLIVAASHEVGDLVVGNAITFRAASNFILSNIRANVNTAPIGATIIIDIKVNGISILSTLLSIDQNEKTSVTAATPAVISNRTVQDNDEITIVINQVGSSTAGVALKVTFLGIYT